jgi:hypothetical protein
VEPGLTLDNARPSVGAILRSTLVRFIGGFGLAPSGDLEAAGQAHRHGQPNGSGALRE